MREDEIGTLAHAFNRMTAQLRDLVEKPRAAHRPPAGHQRGRAGTSAPSSNSTSCCPMWRGRCSRPSATRACGSSCSTATSGRLLTCGETRVRGDVAARPWTTWAACRSCSRWPRPGSRCSGTKRPHGAAPRAGTDRRRREPVGDRRPHPSRGESGRRPGHHLAGPHVLDEQDLFAAQTLADQLAIAIENSRLYEQADELAASRERQRLARDLHDAVSQTLFSVSLIAEVLPRTPTGLPKQPLPTRVPHRLPFRCRRKARPLETCRPHFEWPSAPVDGGPRPASPSSRKDRTDRRPASRVLRSRRSRRDRPAPKRFQSGRRQTIARWHCRKYSAPRMRP